MSISQRHVNGEMTRAGVSAALNRWRNQTYIKAAKYVYHIKAMASGVAKIIKIQ